jgi:hypothetical protein
MMMMMMKNNEKKEPRLFLIAIFLHFIFRYELVPHSDINNLRIFWPIPSHEKRWKEKPERYLAHLLGHEGHGSLFALLKKKGWAQVLVAVTTIRLQDTDLFTGIFIEERERERKCVFFFLFFWFFLLFFLVLSSCLIFVSMLSDCWIYGGRSLTCSRNYCSYLSIHCSP